MSGARPVPKPPRRPLPDRDRVTPAVRLEVLARDRYRCTLARLRPEVERALGRELTPCRDRWGNVLGRWNDTPDLILELHHVKDEPKMGDRAPSDPRHLVAVCPGHHRLSGEATNAEVLAVLREYLARP